MNWWAEVQGRFRKPDVLMITGVFLAALAAATAISYAGKGWRLPVVTFLLVIAVAVLAGPVLRKWREKMWDDDEPFSWTLPITIIVGLLILVAYRAGTPDGIRNTIVTLLLVAGAATVIGVLIGFLFGIPRVAVRSASTSPGDAEGGQTLETNTNLEHISDWLTKIIVGVSLVQANAIADRFDTLLENLAKVHLPRPLMGGMILFFLVAGFLSGYLWTRLVLTRYFSASERSLRETREYYEGLMNAYLYTPAPTGFRKVLDLFETYKKRFGQPTHWRIWVYVACAFGQQYAWMRFAEGRKADELKTLVDGAVDAVRRAGASGEAGALLDSLTQPDDLDGDLAVLASEQPAVRTEVDAVKARS